MTEMVALGVQELAVVSEHLGLFDQKAKFETESDKLKSQAPPEQDVHEKAPVKIAPQAQKSDNNEPLFQENEGTLDWL